MKQVIIHSYSQNKESFSDWLNSIKDKRILARIQKRIDRLELGDYGDYKSVGDGVFELRMFLVQAIACILLKMAKSLLSFCVVVIRIVSQEILPKPKLIGKTIKRINNLR
ncbi:MAG: hypothetical protein R2880_13205 [Deinococcales bacterium]